jgi:hypothetical protein
MLDCSKTLNVSSLVATYFQLSGWSRIVSCYKVLADRQLELLDMVVCD